MLQSRKSRALLQAESMIGSIYNRLTVLNVSDKRSIQGHIYINCLCSCNKEILVWAANVKSGNTKSCGCLAEEKRRLVKQKQRQQAQARSQSLIGKSFGALTIIDTSNKRTKYGHAYVKASCACGKKDVHIMVSALLNRRAISCGCRIVGGKRGKFYAIDPKLSSAKRVYDQSYRDGNLSFDEFLIISRKDCFYCGQPPKNSYNVYSRAGGAFIYNGLDRIDNTKVHDQNNVVPCCIDCNKSKMQRSLSEFLSWIELVYNKQIKNKAL